MSDPRDQPVAYRHEPYDIEVEQSMLGSLLRNNKLIDIAAADLDGHHFYDPLHGRIYDMIVHLQTEGEVTPVILHSVMKSDPGIIETGGLEYLKGLFLAAPYQPPVRQYVAILLELSYRRELIAIAEDIRVSAYESPQFDMTAQKVADTATEALLQAGRAVAEPAITAYDSAMESLKECERIARGEGVAMVKTGMEKVDDELGGLRGGDFIVILGKSGMGKSALMGGISRNTAFAGVPTLVFTLEMRRAQWVERMVCDIDYDDAMAEGQRAMWYSRVRNGKINEAEFARFYLASSKLQGLPLEIIEADDLTVQQIQARARAFKAKWGKNSDGSERVGIVIVDYVQIIEPTDPRDNRERQVAKIARGLKSLGKRLNWPVVVGSQMNENDEGRAKEEKRPQARDARESKAIMNEADIMLSPFRPAYFVENRKPMDAISGDPVWLAWKADLKAVINRFEILMLKNRHGRRIDFDMHCDMGASAIRDHAPRGHAQVAADQHARDLLENV